MIRIDHKKFLADKAIKVIRQNTVPVQQVEQGFGVQDHIESLPLQLELQLILFDKSTWKQVWGSGSKPHWDQFSGKWIDETSGAAVPIWTEDFDEYHEDTYEHLKTIYESKELVKVDCSDHAKNEPSAKTFPYKNTMMIYEDMAMTYLGQVVQRGNVYFCNVKFTHITKTKVKSQTLYIQEAKFETDENGNEVETQGVRWSKEQIEPNTVEDLNILPEGIVGVTLFEGSISAYPEIELEETTESLNPIGHLMGEINDWSSHLGEYMVASAHSNLS